MNVVYRLLNEIRNELQDFKAPWALIGGIAVIVYAEARTTRLKRASLTSQMP